MPDLTLLHALQHFLGPWLQPVICMGVEYGYGSWQEVLQSALWEAVQNAHLVPIICP